MLSYCTNKQLLQRIANFANQKIDCPVPTTPNNYTMPFIFIP
ncbi:hypothetical protein GLA29479_2552 [Lysobacter antibioticus]|nr:hypothetical protein GLA29479_2552 [Lysobacter antibioticus]